MVEKRFGGGLCRNCELSSPVKTLRMGVPAGLAGVGEVGDSPMPIMMTFSAFLGKLLACRGNDHQQSVESCSSIELEC